MFKFHIRGKNGKIEKFHVFTVFTGGAPLFLYHIRGKNDKNQKVYLSYRFYRGALLFLLPYPR